MIEFAEQIIYLSSKKDFKIWLAYLWIKIIYLFFGHFIFARFTQLGDTNHYLSNKSIYSHDIFTNSTVFMYYWGGVLGPFLGSILFLLLAFFGVVYAVEKAEFCYKTKIFIIIVLSFPSFGMWSSIVSKEAIMVFASGIILGIYFDIMKNKRPSIFLLTTAIFIFYIFKPHLLAAVAALLVSGYFYTFFRQHVLLFLLIVGGAYAALNSILIIYSVEIQQIFQTIPNSFHLENTSTRVNIYWTDQDSFLSSAPIGMFLSLWGPTWSEVIQEKLKSIYFLESSILTFILLLTLYKIAFNNCREHLLNPVLIISIFSVLFLLIFANHPFGTLNAGSALRYRSNVYLYLVLLITFLYKQSQNARNSIS